MTSTIGKHRGGRFAWILPLLAAATMLLAATPAAIRACDGGCLPTASGGGPPGGGDPPPDDEECNPQGDPVSPYTGKWYYQYTDLEIKGHYPISMIRRADNQSHYDSPLGHGWSFDYDKRLYKYPDGTVIVRRNCGVRDEYVFSGGAYVPPVANWNALTENPDGSFVLSRTGGDKEFYDVDGKLTALEDYLGHRLEMSYDPIGKLPLTGTSRFSLDPDLPAIVAYDYRLTRIEERAADGTLTGNFVELFYEPASGRLKRILANDGRDVSYEHDTSDTAKNGNLIRVDGLGAVVSRFEYNDPLDPHNVTSIQVGGGSTPYLNTYDDQDRVTSQDYGLGSIAFDYVIPGVETRVTNTVKDPGGTVLHTAITTYEYDDNSFPVRVTDALGNETVTIRNSDGRATRTEVWEKQGTELVLLSAENVTYDTSGNPLSRSVALDSGEVITWTWAYDQHWPLFEQVVSSLDPTRIFREEYTYYYAPDGRPLNLKEFKRRRDDGSYVVTTHTYNANQQLDTITLPDGLQVGYTYTGPNVSTLTLLVEGSPVPQFARQFAYDQYGNQASITDANGNLTRFEYDESGRLKKKTNALGFETRYTYRSGKLEQVEVGFNAGIHADPDEPDPGQLFKLAHDGQHRLVSLSRWDGSAWVTQESNTYDSDGNLLSMSDGENRTNNFSYDALGNLVSASDPLGKVTTYTYDALGRRTSETDPLNRTTLLFHDDLGRPIRVERNGPGLSAVTLASYDAAGNIKSLTDPQNNTTTYAFDGLSNQIELVQSLGQTVSYTHNDRGRIETVVNARGNLLRLNYHPWGAVASIEHYATETAPTPDRTMQFAYDNNANLLQVWDDRIQAGPLYTTTYDALNRTRDIDVNYIPGTPKTLSYRYDRFGNRLQFAIDDGSNLLQTYEYDALNRLIASVLPGDETIGLSYTNANEIQQITYPNGVTTNLSYWDNGPVKDITINDAAGPLEQFAFTYNDARMLVTLTEMLGVHGYDFDELDRVTDASHPAGSGLPASEQFDYDLAGNREDPLDPDLYDYDANNRLIDSPLGQYNFDDDGNLIEVVGQWTGSYDFVNRMVAVNVGSTTASYDYDLAGRRIRKTVDGNTVWYLWDQNRLVAEYDDAGNRIRSYAYLTGDYAPSRVSDANGSYYVHTDHLQTPRLLTDAGQNVVWQAYYETYGLAQVSDDPDGNGTPVEFNMRFPGQYYDAETGLHYNVNRYYDPASGRYTRADPLGQSGGMNVYLYANANSVVNFDALGLECVTFGTYELPGPTKTLSRDREWDGEWFLRHAQPTLALSPTPVAKGAKWIKWYKKIKNYKKILDNILDVVYAKCFLARRYIETIKYQAQKRKITWGMCNDCEGRRLFFDEELLPGRTWEEEEKGQEPANIIVDIPAYNQGIANAACQQAVSQMNSGL